MALRLPWPHATAPILPTPSWQQITSTGVAGWAGQCDVSDEASVQSFFERASAELGVIDILVNNAGIARDTHVVLTDTARWHGVLDVNIDGAFHCVRAVVRGMLLKNGAAS